MFKNVEERYVLKIYSGLDNFSAGKPVVTIGMFDGLHAGHRILLQQVIDKARSINGESVIVSFWPHPRVVLNQDADKLRFLTSLEEKTRLFSETGIDHLVLLPFTKEMARLSAENFVREVLVDIIGVNLLVVGYNHRFGKGRQHSFEEYKQIAQNYRFEILKIEPVEIDGLHISSSKIRQHLLKGEIQIANKILSYNYLLSGRVVGGMKLGRTLGYPTANIEVEEPHKLIPPDGVYACVVTIEGKKWGGMLNIGYRPTIKHNVDNQSIEVHILDFNRDIYSEEIVVEFIDRIRDEQKFEQLDDLKKQLKLDEKRIRKALRLFI